jgi:Arc/MetJ-type ribon-helix-helix transcriptional regulator
MTIALTKEVEAFVEEQIRAGVCPNASTLVNDVLLSLSEHRQRPFSATPELETWLLEAADSPTSPLTQADFDGIRQRATQARSAATKKLSF